MIGVNKREDVPATLRTRGASKTSALCKRFARNRAKYRDGKLKFEFDSSIYAAEDVKEALLADQHHKCAFCESKLSHIAFGDVEHFRPKAAIRQRRKSKLRRPGYFWLAYDWRNLFVSCQLCNQRFKRNTFPIARGRLRACGPTGRVSLEDRGLIDPASENPEKQIEWREHVPVARGGSRRGRLTIRIMALQRSELSSRREERLDVARRLIDALKVYRRDPTRHAADIAATQAWFVRQVEDPSEYAAMMREFLRAVRGEDGKWVVEI